MTTQSPLRIPCTIIRGGTSRAVVVKSSDLPANIVARDKLIQRIFGSPDPRQIDGLGGADPLTSKVAIIGKPSRPDADLDYTFGQVEIIIDEIDYAGLCGNISSAVAAYAVDEGYAATNGAEATVRIHLVNTGRLLRATVPVKDGRRVEEGEFAIDGVPGTGAPIALDFADAVGGITGKLLPTGNAVDKLQVDGVGEVELTVVDVANLMIYMRGSTLGVKAQDDLLELNQRTDLFIKLQKIREAVASVIGLKEVTGSFPMLALIGGPENYNTYGTNKLVPKDTMDIWVRELVVHTIHKAYSGTGSVCTAVAALIPGSVVNQVAQLRSNSGKLRLGHPSGIMVPEGKVDTGPELRVRNAIVYRTARRIMDGVVYVPA